MKISKITDSTKQRRIKYKSECARLEKEIEKLREAKEEIVMHALSLEEKLRHKNSLTSLVKDVFTVIICAASLILR